MSPRRCARSRWTKWSWLASCALAGVLTLAWCAWAGEPPAKPEQPPKPTTITTGSGQQYITTVHRKPEGVLNPEDFRQVSLLSSRIVSHLNQAVWNLTDERAEEARTELERARRLVKVVRDLLPTTLVTTVVKDAKGKEVYHCVDRVQDDRIPLHEGTVAIDVLEPVTDAKKDAAAVEGIRLADVGLLHTSVLLELDYVERKLDRALKLLKDKPEEALAQLALAQTRGVTFLVNKEDNPLVAAQRALQIAERMVEQDRLEAATANLQLAKNHLVLYRGLIAKEEGEKVRKLEKDITRLQGDIATEGAAKMIREFWNRVAGWFTQQPGKAQPTEEKPEKTTQRQK